MSACKSVRIVGGVLNEYLRFPHGLFVLLKHHLYSLASNQPNVAPTLTLDPFILWGLSL